MSQLTLYSATNLSHNTLNESGRGLILKYSEFKRWLFKQGVEVVREGKGSHKIIAYKGKKTVFPDHGSQEMNENLRKKIIKDLGL